MTPRKPALSQRPTCDVCRQRGGAPRSHYANAAGFAPWITHVCAHCVQAAARRSARHTGKLAVTEAARR